MYLTGDDEQIIDLVKGGQAVFGLALGQVHTDMHTTLTHLPAEPPGRAPEPAGRPALRIVS